MLVFGHGHKEAKKPTCCRARKTCCQGSLGRLDADRKDRPREKGWKGSLGRTDKDRAQ